MTLAGERIEISTFAPPEITSLFLTPYTWIKNLNYSPDTKFLEVGGGSQRLGKKLLNACDVDYSPECENDYTATGDKLPFTNNAFDWTICFETIEHCKMPLRTVEELLRVTTCSVFISSVNLDGPNFLGKNAIWKRADNPYHISEMNSKQFEDLFRGLKVEFFGLMKLAGRMEFVVVEGLHERSYSNVVRIKC